MSLNTMSQRMILEVPGLPSPYSRTVLNEALGLIQDSQMWSFQLQVAGWLTPGLLFPGGPGTSTGTVTFTPYSNIVTADATATSAWNNYNSANKLPLFTQCQIRSPYYSLYSIIGFGDGAGGGYGVGGYGTGGYGFGSGGSAYVVLDRPWMEPGGAGQKYMIYQAYFPVPVPDFKRFLAARDTTNNAPMDYWSLSQKDLAVKDPERTIFDDPAYFVPFQPDNRLLSATLGNMLYELWPHPLSVLPYTYNYLRRGTQLLNPSDTVPYPLTEEALLWRAKEVAYLFKEANKGDDMQRGSGADYRFLAQSANEEFKAVMKPIKDRDRDLVELYWMKYCPDIYKTGNPYATTNMQLNVGRF